MRGLVKTSLIEVTDALTEFGLSQDILTEALLAGEYDRDACTANDPPSSPGFYSWSKTVRRLREILIPSGWTRSDEGNFSVIISPDKKMAIAVQTGDEGTGKTELIPKTKYPRGPKVLNAVNQNMHLWDQELNKQIIEGQKTPKMETWMLLRCRAEDTLFWEFSLPDGIGEDRRVEKWAQRIVPSSIRLEPVPLAEEEEDQQQAIEVPVRRRS